MKKITKLNVLGEIIKVKSVKMDEQYLGLYYHDEKLIEINQESPPDVYATTVIHELFHAAWRRGSLNQTEISSDLEEIIVDLFSKVVTENFKLTKK
jgi:Zn-dependent peptidase ImmA (M78 family)